MTSGCCPSALMPPRPLPPRRCRLVDAAYENRGVAVSSNLRAQLDELRPKTLTTATVDRLMHYAQACQTAGDSIRLSQALAGEEVMSLSR